MTESIVFYWTEERFMGHPFVDIFGFWVTIQDELATISYTDIELSSQWPRILSGT